MKVWVSPLSKVHQTAAGARPDGVVSLLSPGDIFPQIDGIEHGDHHKVHLHDIREAQKGHITPGEEHVAAIIRFLERRSPRDVLLIHCWAGISRSTATAFIAACIHNPSKDEREIAAALRDASPTAFPNTLIVAHADRLMERDGRMAAAVEEICKDEERAARVICEGEGAPFYIPARF